MGDEAINMEMGPIPYVTGFPSLANFMVSDDEHSGIIFRRFRRLSARNLLYMQSELAELEAQQEKYDREDAALTTTVSEKAGLRDWSVFEKRANSKVDREKTRMELAEKINAQLKQYRMSDTKPPNAWTLQTG